MPVSLTTGLPGHGKTLWTLQHVEALRKSTGREVFYSGIEALTLPWTMFGEEVNKEKPHMTDASKWYDLPAGAIIVIDEAQRLFRPRAPGQTPPEYVSRLEVHRHSGYDIFLITQHPSLIDTHVRRLTDTHRHLMRKFGSKWSTVHRWVGVREQCDKSRKDSISEEWRHPTDLYKWYKSAEVHTVKFRLPAKLWLAIAFILFLIGLGVYFVYFRLGAAGTAPSSPAGKPSSSRVQAGNTPGAQSGPQAGRAAAPGTGADIVRAVLPRIEGLPHTAPRYDALTVPVRVPVIVGCWQSVDQSEGWCVTQQGTRVYPPKVTMASYIKNGMFVDFDAGPRLGEENERGSSDGGKQVKPAVVQ